MMPTSKKVIEIVAGPNGSGKTTFAQVYLLDKQSRVIYLNPDRIAAGIAKRVRLGGHPIPSEAVYRRHPRCFRNFWQPVPKRLS